MDVSLLFEDKLIKLFFEENQVHSKFYSEVVRQAFADPCRMVLELLVFDLRHRNVKIEHLSHTNFANLDRINPILNRTSFGLLTSD